MALLSGVGKQAVGLGHILTTPLFMNGVGLNMLRALKEQVGSHICFDSAGYYVQVGRISYDDLYYRLLCCYRNNPWADRYVLPDNVPLASENADQKESARIVWAKVQQTVDMSCIFWEELPREMRAKTVPVVHGHTPEQIEYCLRRYLQLDRIAALGFGSFVTTGKKNEANITSDRAVANVRLVVEAAHRNGLSVHLFGLGVPAVVGLINSLGAGSFDSASWLKSAGFGQVCLPFTRSYNITHRSTRSKLQQGISWEQFSEMRELTGHDCHFCRDRDLLSEKKMYRAMHNLLCLAESVGAVNNGEEERIAGIYAQSSPKYRKAYLQWQQMTTLQTRN